MAEPARAAGDEHLVGRVGVRLNGDGFQNARIAWSPSSAGPTSTPVPLVSSAIPLTWSIRAFAALLSAARCIASPSAGVSAGEHVALNRLSVAIALLRLPASAAAWAWESRSLSSAASPAASSGRGLITATPLACAFVSGALRMTFERFVAVAAAWSFASGSLSTTFGAGAAGTGVMCRSTRITSRFAPVSSTIGWPAIGPLLLGAFTPP